MKQTMPTSSGFVFSMQDGVATLRLDREAQHNRIDPADLEGLRRVLAHLQADANAVALVITGTGTRTFSSGYTLSQLANNHIDTSFELFLNELEMLPVTTICALNGSVYGGSIDLALCCDIRLGVTGSRMFMPAAKIGLHYYPDGMRRYVRELGLMQARRLFLTAMEIDATEMLRIGVLTELVPPDVLPERVQEYVDALQKCDASTVRSMKAQLHAVAAGDHEAAKSRAHYEASLQSSTLGERVARLGKVRAE
ncbi:enoyl-CoA hydratase/isomerase family protein [Paraburkholderia sp. BCC1886]|uniref:enoyl-CoA hydratase/isomerase family protein n=1 Tax=Paraburkholderia sp. BCC1886 TaxID=2562670 RepID=UPI00118398F3|nr:enoyl-CoA hydratase/isomerase family protein [Paraburkholderia sp. BCC1886]